MNTTVDLNVASYKLPVLVHYVQHSTEIPIDFIIHDYEIPSGATARFYLRKPSGNEVYNDCTISGNKITLQPSAQTFAEKGLQKAQLQLMIEDKFLISFPIDFDVAENIIDSSAIESSNEYGALETLLQEAQENIPAAGEAAEAANQAAEAANTAAGVANTATKMPTPQLAQQITRPMQLIQPQDRRTPQQVRRIPLPAKQIPLGIPQIRQLRQLIRQPKTQTTQLPLFKIS